jgi:hypothetical protein
MNKIINYFLKLLAMYDFNNGRECRINFYAYIEEYSRLYHEYVQNEHFCEYWEDQ